MSARTSGSGQQARRPVEAPKENPAKTIGNLNSFFSQARAVCTSATSPRPSSCRPALSPVPRKLNRSTGNPTECSAFMAWKTTLLCIVPPNTGCGWQTSPACVAVAEPTFSRASSRPAGPSRKNDRIAECEYANCRPPSLSGLEPPPSLHHVVDRPNPPAQRICRLHSFPHILLGTPDGRRQLLPERQLAGYRHSEGASRSVG